MYNSGKDIYNNKRNQKIYKACYNACRSLFKAKPVYINENKEKITEKITDLMFNGILERHELICEFFVEEKPDFFGTIVLADCIDESDQIIEFYVNFYEFKNRKEMTLIHMVKFYTGEESEMIVHGKNLEEISKFETTLNSKAQRKEDTSERRFSLNEKIMVVISGYVFIIVFGAIFFKEKILFKKPLSYYDFFAPRGNFCLIKH